MRPGGRGRPGWGGAAAGAGRGGGGLPGGPQQPGDRAIGLLLLLLLLLLLYLMVEGVVGPVVHCLVVRGVGHQTVVRVQVGNLWW